MKQKLAYGLLAVVLVIAVGWSWRSISGGGAAASGYPLVCSKCQHFFTLSEDELNTHPRSPEGKGLQCPKCGKFGAKIGVQCSNCGKWYIHEGGRGSAAVCPQCAPKTEPSAR